MGFRNHVKLLNTSCKINLQYLFTNKTIKIQLTPLGNLLQLAQFYSPTKKKYISSFDTSQYISTL